MMERKTAHDFDPELLILFDAYVHGAVDRRGFLDRARKFAIGGVTSAMLLDALNPKFAEAQQVKKDDPRIKAEYVEYDSPQGYGKMKGYLVRPAVAAKWAWLGAAALLLGAGTIWLEHRYREPVDLVLESVPLRVSPHGRGSALAALDEGQALIRLRSQRGWNLVRDPSGRLGWVPAQSVASVNPK